ncbi:MAG TPA: hypothetical protein VMZ52_18330 [Bryobacteraceae bacterium]|nr:hypothetical protein [Bryobacteraceae bacterium]
MATLAIVPPDIKEQRSYVPPVPHSLEEAQVSPTQVEALLLKVLYLEGEVLGRDLSHRLGLKFSLIADTLSALRQNKLISVKRSLGMGDVSSVFCLSAVGIELAQAALAKNQYAGRAPVTLSQYTQAVLAQKHRENWLTSAALRNAYKNMIVGEKVLSQIGPAVNAGKSLLIYGQPGNGKTFLAEALLKIESMDIFVPYAIEFQGQIIRVFDAAYHQPIEEPAAANELAYDDPYDARWVRCRPPFITTGGELTLGMLDLSYDTHTKIYDAPYQMKANNGIYLVDDFGRQRVTPVEVLNRWIIPMERRIDYLSFATGGKMTVPFEAFLVFSTNLTPERLGDEAFLRRIQYKMHLKNPDREEFVQLFFHAAKARNLSPAREMVDVFIEKHYVKTGKRQRRCHPRDIMSHAVDLLHFERMPYELTHDVLDHAFESCFGDSGADEEIQ